MTAKSLKAIAVGDDVTGAGPRWRRRKSERPGEIVAAAFAEFAERGFAAARLEDVAARAGVSKAALYRYFDTKADLFRAVAETAAAEALERLRPMVLAEGVRFDRVVPTILAAVAEIGGAARTGAVARMVIGESRSFPDLARAWHDAVAGRALGLLTEVVAAAQARGEVRPGDPRLHALSLMGPMIVGLLWREVFVPVGGAPVDLRALAAQHAATMVEGLRNRSGEHP